MQVQSVHVHVHHALLHMIINEVVVTCILNRTTTDIKNVILILFLTAQQYVWKLHVICVTCTLCILETIFIIKRRNKCTAKGHHRHNPRVLAKEWKRGAALLYAMPFPFDVVKGMQSNHKYALMFVSALLC